MFVGPLRSNAAAGAPVSRYIVVWRDDADADGETDVFERSENVRAEFRYSHALKGFAATLTAAQLARLERYPRVKFISADREVHAIGGVPLASGDVAPTGVRRIEAATTTTASQASTVAVAVIDTGIQLAHPDLNAVSGKNCISTGATANDDNGHGTHVSGTIAAKNNGSGVVGVAPGTQLYAVKVLDSGGGGTWGQVICGIDWVTENAAALNIKVASMSLGGSGSNDNNCGNSNLDALHQAICRSTAAGVTYVIAAGNSGADYALFVPAAYPEALTVTAMSDSDGNPGAAGGAPTCRTGELDDRFASFSNWAFGAAAINHTIAGPGVCINSTWLAGGYNTISGTSMATPHLSGTVALCLGSGGVAGPCNGLTPAQIVQRIRADAQAHATVANGFDGDPLHPVTGKYFGYLASAAEYSAPDTTPPTISAVAASTTVTSATITWTTNEPASSQVEYWTDPAFPTATAVTDTAPRVIDHSVTIGGLTASTTYGFHVKSADAANNLAQSSPDSSFTTLTPDTQPPSTPGSFSAAAASASQINLSWTASNDNVAVKNYILERCDGGATCTGPYGQIATPTATSFSDTGRAAATSYGYRVSAIDAAGNTSGYAFANATTPAAPSSLLAAYAFSEGSGTTTADASGKGHTGTLSGATWTNAGKYGQALSFNGSTSYVDLGNAADLQLTGSMTVSAWIFATANPPDDGQIVSKSTGAGWQFKTSPDTGPHTFAVAVSPNSSSNTQRYSNTVRALNTWYYVTGVYDATAGTLNIYVNGVLDNGVLSGTVPPSQYNAPANVNVGQRGGGYLFQGTIDEVRIYNRALSPAEIQSDMNTAIGGP